MLKKILSIFLIFLHLLTLGSIRDALAFFSQSQSFKLTSGAFSEGGKSRSPAASDLSKLWHDAIGEPAIGRAQSASYALSSGYIPAIRSNPPLQTKPITNQSWQENASKADAFDLDDYFASLEGLVLAYAVSGNSKISVVVDQNSHLVSFSQPQGWSGIEKVIFTATDSEYSSVSGNEVTLQVEGVDNPPVLDYIPDIAVNEGELVKITAQATDLDGDAITYSFSAPLNSSGSWQTGYDSAGTYSITVTATDATGLIDTQSVIINLKNVNRKPILNTISDISAKEGDLVVVTPIASDPDGDALTFYYSAPFDSTGKWLTDYSSSGSYPATVTVSDGIDTVSQSFTITIANVNQPPTVNLSLSKYTVNPDEEITITITASDPDGDNLNFSLKKDGSEIASGLITNTYTATTSFSSPGDHTISVSAADTGGLSASGSQAVDVVDPDLNQNIIFPVMGDYNGDALTDLGLYNSQAGTWEIALSEKGSFSSALDWLTNFGANNSWIPIGGDYNADGKTDAAIYNSTSGELKVALSSGSSFSDAGIWLTVSFTSNSWQPFSGNFNADRYLDFGLYNKDSGEIRIAPGSGSGFSGFTTWYQGSDAIGYTVLSGDFNADSISDLCLFKKSTGEFKVAFSDTKSFVALAVWISGFSQDKDAILSDFNQDGLTDIGYWEKSNFNWYYAVSTGAQFVSKGALLTFGSSIADSGATGDFDGNGIADYACFDRGSVGINRWKAQLSSNKPADLLVELDNGIGGKTQVTYSYAASQDNNAVSFPIYVVSSTSLVDTLPLDQPQESYTQLFSYSGAYYDYTEKEFRGFSKVKAADPLTNNYTETYFYQGKPGQETALKGQIEKLIAYDGNARKISQTVNSYEVRNAGPQDRVLGFPSLKEQTVTAWEENDSSLTTRQSFTYDNIGNVLEQRQEGDIAKTGDEKSGSTTYARAYTEGFNRPLEVLLKDKDANTVSKKSFDYDTKGNLLKETAHIFNPLTADSELSTVSYAYDSFGNLLSSTNALGASVITDYETTFYAYPEKITNSLGQIISYVYEPKFGVVKSVTDANGVISSTSYDSLGRVTQVTNGLNQITAAYSYPDFNTKIAANAIGLSSTEYLDGLGRKYKTVSAGEDGNLPRKVSSETFYNPRGLVEKKSLPHYIDQSSSDVSYIRYEYDMRGRLKKTISDFPGITKDAESSINYISPLYSETLDPLGHKKGSLKDVYGNIIEVTEFTQGGVYKSNYEYDTQGNLIKTTDSQGDLTQIFYDSLGRKLKMVDPDMGAWSYEYDLIGNLKRQTDAKGQALEFEYDSLNRLSAKNGLSLQGAVPLRLATYIYDDPAKPNSIGRLSKVIDQSGSTEFFYDTLGREVKSIKSLRGTEGSEAISYAVEREYDILDRLTKLTYPDGESVSYSYDANSGLLESLRGTKGAEAISYVQGIDYNAQGQIKTIQYGNGVSTAYSYGQDLRLSRILTSNPTSTLQNLNYIFDQNGNLKTLTDNLRSNIRGFTYDELDRLTQAQNLPAANGGYTAYNYQYDSIGNMLYKSDIGIMSYGQTAGPHALTSAAGYLYTYDANGNMLSGKNKAMEYDLENRLSKVDASGIITSFLYDGDGGRVKKTQERNNAITQVTTYIGSLFEINTDYADSGQRTEIKKHIFAGSNRICTIKSADNEPSTIDYYHSDHLGSSNVITDQNGNQLASYEYTPYGTLAGNELANAQTPQPVNHYFTGKELDATGLYFYGARYYDPEIGRFISADTIVQAPYDPQSLNRYSYCRNNPINYIDPTGHFFWAAIIIGAILGAASAAANDQPIWQGALMGGAGGLMVGAGAAAFGFWGAVGGGMFAGAGTAAVTGGNIGFGVLAGGLGAGLGYGLGSWVNGWSSGSFWGEFGAGAFAGAVVGGVGAELEGGDFGRGAGMGAAYGSAGFLGSKAVNTLDPRVRQTQRLQREARARHALNSKKNDMIKIPLGSRSAIGPAGHRFLPGWEMGPGPGGKIYTSTTIKDLSKWDTHLTTQKAIASGNARFTTAEVSASGLVDAKALYDQNWVSTDTSYSAGSYNSNYAVNTVIYSAGGSVPGGLGWTPDSRISPSSVFYPYVYRDE